MKTRIETVPVPAEPAREFERTFYVCEHCAYESEDEDEVKTHYATNHTAKKETKIGGRDFYWFDAEEDAKVWLDPPVDFREPGDTTVHWEGPGWYGFSSAHGTGRCRCGGCSYTDSALHAAHSYLQDWEKEIEKHKASIEARKQHIAELQTLIQPETKS